MAKAEFTRIQETTILRVLYHVRAEIVRDGRDGLEHVDALLIARGTDPEARPIPEARPRRFRRNRLTLAILRRLREGPATATEIAASLGNHPRMRRNVSNALAKLMARGVVTRRMGGAGRYVWGLAGQPEG